jgi:hypothetical protein
MLTSKHNLPKLTSEVATGLPVAIEAMVAACPGVIPQSGDERVAPDSADPDGKIRQAVGRKLRSRGTGELCGGRGESPEHHRVDARDSL